MSNLLIIHFIAKKESYGKRKRKIVVTSDGTLFCRLRREEEEKRERERRKGGKYVG